VQPQRKPQIQASSNKIDTAERRKKQTLPSSSSWGWVIFMVVASRESGAVGMNSNGISGSPPGVNMKTHIEEMEQRRVSQREQRQHTWHAVLHTTTTVLQQAAPSPTTHTRSLSACCSSLKCQLSQKLALRLPNNTQTACVFPCKVGTRAGGRGGVGLACCGRPVFFRHLVSLTPIYFFPLICKSEITGGAIRS
jgi:hypothetical protein